MPLSKQEASEFYKLGYDAYEANVKLTENPYRIGTPEYSEWQAGWFAAEEDDSPLCILFE